MAKSVFSRVPKFLVHLADLVAFESLYEMLVKTGLSHELDSAMITLPEIKIGDGNSLALRIWRPDLLDEGRHSAIDCSIRCPSPDVEGVMRDLWAVTIGFRLVPGRFSWGVCFPTDSAVPYTGSKPEIGFVASGDSVQKISYARALQAAQSLLSFYQKLA